MKLILECGVNLRLRYQNINAKLPRNLHYTRKKEGNIPFKEKYLDFEEIGIV